MIEWKPITETPIEDKPLLLLNLPTRQLRVGCFTLDGWIKDGDKTEDGCWNAYVGGMYLESDMFGEGIDSDYEPTFEITHWTYMNIPPQP